MCIHIKMMNQIGEPTLIYTLTNIFFLSTLTNLVTIGRKDIV